MGTSIAIVNLLGIIGIFLLPTLSSFLIFEPFQSGLWVGSTLQAVGHVAASGEMIGLHGGNLRLQSKWDAYFFCYLWSCGWAFFQMAANLPCSHEQSILQKSRIFGICGVLYSSYSSISILFQNFIPSSRTYHRQHS